MRINIGALAIAAGLFGTMLIPQNQKRDSMPNLGGAVGWLNSSPLSAKSLRGKVVLINFWTYTCINSLRPMPYVKSWAAKYKGAGLVVIGVHTPEFSFEHERSNVEWATRTLAISFPVAIDSDYNTWRAFHNEAWPAQYIVDAEGHIRYQHYGEGEYVQMEHVIQTLLKENGATGLDENTVSISGVGVEAPPGNDQRSPETYVGYERAEHFASPETVARDSRRTYSAPHSTSLNQWGLVGTWSVGTEAAVLHVVPGRVLFRFHSRDLNLILAPAKDGKPIRFKVTLDGSPPGDKNGIDARTDGTGEIREPRMYQLIRQKNLPIRDRTFEIEFLDPGAQVFDFTFG